MSRVIVASSLNGESRRTTIPAPRNVLHKTRSTRDMRQLPIATLLQLHLRLTPPRPSGGNLNTPSYAGLFKTDFQTPNHLILDRLQFSLTSASQKLTTHKVRLVMTRLTISILGMSIPLTSMDQTNHHTRRMSSNHPPLQTRVTTYLLMPTLHDVAEQEQVPNFPISG